MLKTLGLGLESQGHRLKLKWLHQRSTQSMYRWVDCCFQQSFRVTNFGTNGKPVLHRLWDTGNNWSNFCCWWAGYAVVWKRPRKPMTTEFGMKNPQTLGNRTVYTVFRYFKPFWRESLAWRTDRGNCDSNSGVWGRALKKRQASPTSEQLIADKRTKAWAKWRYCIS